VDDPRVLLWDLCNEPKVNPHHTDNNPLWLGWLGRARAAIEALGDRGRITVGACGPASSIALLEPLCDVLTVHPYFAWNMFCKTAQEFHQHADEKSDGRRKKAVENDRRRAHYAASQPPTRPSWSSPPMAGSTPGSTG
jgi:hypothetical protein